MVGIVTNTASLNAQNNLSKSSNDLQTSLQRLSSGLRINSAKDDAAGLAISNRMTAQITGLNQAVRNANDGISLAQTAEGAMQESTNILQRMRELSIQSANATNSGSDREALQAEVSQLVSELDRIATTTEFNGLNLLDGSFSNQQFQVGANANQTISVSVSGARTNQLGSVVNTSSTVAQTGAFTVDAGPTNFTASAAVAAIDTFTGVDANETDANVKINGSLVADSGNFEGTLTGQTGDSAYAKAAAINGSNISGVDAVANTEKTIAGIAGDATNLVAFTQGTAGTDDTATYSLTINGEEVISTTLDGTNNTLSIDDAIENINSASSKTGVAASKNDSGELVLTASDGRNIEISETLAVVDGATTATGAGNIKSAIGGTFTQTAANTAADATNTATYRGDITLQSTDSVTIDTGGSALGFTATLLAKDTSQNIATVDISTVSGSNDAILAIDAALASIDTNRASLGAIQNRFESTIANLSNVSENLAGARGRIMDTDFAAETANLTKNQILQQAGTAMLAQANSLPQSVLSLLQ
ncbi:flagellin [Amphritea sp.]|uniref:flagellin N-terminal helical domain-containing protein n=1 Tax=Amphritea sp. TaxID=1872502 RepID=UPI003563D1F2